MSDGRGHSFNFSLGLGILVGTFVAISWVNFVNDLVDTADLFHDTDHWINLARNEAYGLCYNGCGDSCLDHSIIADACHKTAQVNLPFCDASEIWFWADRYPAPCLEAVAEIYKEDAIYWKRFWLRGLYLLSLVFGIVACLVMCVIVELVVKSGGRRLPVTARRRWGGVRAPLLPGTLVAVSLILAILANPSAAYPCPNYSPPYDRHFANANGTVYGVVHGWLSNCYDEVYECGKSCTTSLIGGRVTCTPKSCTRPKPSYSPADFVNDTVWLVENCGFSFVDAVPGVVDRRIPNPKIEGTLWVGIAVNTFNSTDAGEEKLDEGVKCLYEMI